jgi:hypothetical protein
MSDLSSKIEIIERAVRQALSEVSSTFQCDELDWCYGVIEALEVTAEGYKMRAQELEDEPDDEFDDDDVDEVLG